MRINKPVGSKDRLIEMFQKVNKVKLNEGIFEGDGVGLNPENVLNMAFNQLKNKRLNVEHSNTQANGPESFVELMCTDPQGNNITFTFKTTSQEGDQEGVFNVGSVQLDSFSFDSADGEETVELATEGLQRFNQQHANEMFDVIQDYLDVEPEGAESQETSNELAEAIKLIDAIKKDSSPYDGGFDKMQTGQNYGDKKPTNDKVRVKSAELNKFIQEELDEMDKPAMKLKMQPVLEDVTGEQDATFVKLQLDASENNGWDIWKDGEVISLRPRNTYNFLMQVTPDGNIKVVKGMENDLDPMIQAAGRQVVNKIRAYYKQKPGLSEMDKPIAGMSLGGIVEDDDENQFDDDDQEVDLDNLEGEPEGDEPIAPEEVPTVDDPLPVDNEPAPEVSPEKKAKIYQAYDAIIARQRNPNYSPTTAEIMAELDRMAGVTKPKNVRTVSKEAEPYLAEEEEKSAYPDPMGKKFKPKSHYPKKKKKAQSVVKISENEEEIPYDNNAKQAARADMKAEKGLPGNKKPEDWDKYSPQYYRRYNVNVDGRRMDEEKPEGDENPELSQLEKDNPDVYPEGWKEMDGMFMGPGSPGYGKGGEVEPPTEYVEPNMDMFANGVPDEMKTEPEGEELEGGKADGMSGKEFDPEQLAKGLKVEMEHTDDPKVALEIAMDHLAEIPDYYDRLDTMEKEAGVEGVEGGEESSDDKEMTDVLLGFKPHNVGDEIEGEEEEEEIEEPEAEETPEEPEEEKKEIDEDLGFSQTDTQRADAGMDYSKIPDEQLEKLLNLADKSGVGYIKNAAAVELAKRQVQKAKEQGAQSLYESKQIKLAKETLSNRNVPTGMSKKDAVQLLVKHLIK